MLSGPEKATLGAVRLVGRITGLSVVILGPILRPRVHIPSRLSTGGDSKMHARRQGQCPGPGKKFMATVSLPLLGAVSTRQGQATAIPPAPSPAHPGLPVPLTPPVFSLASEYLRDNTSCLYHVKASPFEMHV